MSDTDTKDAALLMLIVDDDQALRVLAAWAALAPLLECERDPEFHTAIAEIANVQARHVPACLARLRAARVLRDQGITELADKMLQTCVQKQLERKR